MKKYLIRGISIMTTLCMLPGMAPLTIAETTAKQWGWDAESGRLAVDYEAFLSKHDLIYTTLPTDGEIEGMPVANGQTGAMVWQDDGIRMQIHSVDNAQHSAFSAAQVRLSTTPALNGNDGFEQRLHLYDGYVSIAQNNGFTAEVFGLPDSETLGLHVKDTREGIKQVTFDVEMWTASDSTLNLSGTADASAWKTITRFEKDGVIRYTKGISDIEPFGYAFAVTVDGADYDIIPIDEHTARIYITPPENGEYTLWMNASSRYHLESENVVGAYETATYSSTAEDVFEMAATALEDAQKQGYEEGLNASKAWWHDYWQRSFVQYQNTDATESDYLENTYYISQYQLGGAAYALNQQHFMRAVYNTLKDEDIRWNYGYWHYNQRAIYHGFLSSNRVEGYLPYLNFYNGLMEPMTTYTVEYFNEETNTEHGFIDPTVTDAMKTWETIVWDGSGYNNDHTGLIFSTGAEIAENMFRAYRYSMDQSLLEQYYEYIRRTVKFFTEWARWDEATGTYQLEYSNSLETWWRINNSTVDNASIRGLFPLFLEAAEILGREEQDAELIAKATDVLAKLEPITMTTTDDGLPRYAAYDVNDYTVDKTNRQNPELEVVYPHDLVGVDHEELQIAINTYNERYKNTHKTDIWCVDGIHAARLGLGDDAEAQMGTMIELMQKRINGFTDDDNGKMESMGLHISTMNEMMLQSYDGIIRAFPAAPSGNDFKGAFTLLADGGFLVSSEYADGAVRYIGVKSQHGGTATVKAPWEADTVLVNGVETAVVDGKIVLETEKDASYLIQQVADAEVVYETVAFSGTANTARKAAFNRTLGIAAEDKRAGIVSAEYDFDDAITDNAFTDKRNGNTAAIMGSGTTVQTREEGNQAVSFNGSGYLEISSSATFDPMSNYSVSFDMNTTSTSTMTLFDKYGSNQGLYLDFYQSKLRVLIAGKVLLNVAATEILDGNWHTVQVDVDTANGTVTLWYDGVQKGQAAFTATTVYTDQPAYIAMNRQFKYGYVGLLDNFKIVPLDDEQAVVTPTDDLYTVSYNKSLTVATPGVFSNDTEDAANLLAELSASTQNGTLKFFEDGAFIYTPNTDFTGIDTFTYDILRFGEKLGSATVTLQVGIVPEAEKDVYQIYYGDSLQQNVTLNDKTGTGALLKAGEYEVEFVPTETQTTCPVQLDADGSFSYTAPTVPTATGAYYDPKITFQYRIKTEVDGMVVYSEPCEVEIRVTRTTYASLFYDFNQPFTDGKVTDRTGNGNDGIILGGVTQTEAGTALFDGTGSIQIPHSDTFDLRDGFELSMKIKADKNRTQVLFDKSNVPGSVRTYGLYVDVYNGRIRVFDTAQRLSIPCPFSMDEFTEFRLVYSLEEGGIKLYLNGELAGSADLDHTVTYVTSYANIGCRLRDGTYFFAGEIDDFCIRNYPLPDGDLDGDGTLTVADAMMLLRYLDGHDVYLSGSPDLNGDGKVRVFDVVLLLQKLVS